MGQGRDITQAAGEIEKDIGIGAGVQTHAEGTSGLAGAGRDIKFAFGDQTFHNLGHFWRKTTKSINHQVKGFTKSIFPGLYTHGSIEIGVLHFVESEQASLQLKIFLRQRVVRFGHRQHLLDHLRVCFTTQMSRRHQVRIVSQFCFLTVIKQEVVKAAGQHQRIVGVLIEKGRKGRFANLAIRVVNQRQQLLTCGLTFFCFSRELVRIGKACGQFIKKLHKRLFAGEILAFKSLLDSFALGICSMSSNR